MAIVLGGGTSAFAPHFKTGFSGKHPDFMPFDRNGLKMLEQFEAAQSKKIIDADRSKFFTVNRYSSFLSGTLIPEMPELPIEISLLASEQDKPLLPVYDYGCIFWIVNDDVRKLIDSYDTDKHQFIPVRFLNSDGKDFGAPIYFAVNLGLFLDTVSRPESHLTYRKKPDFGGKPGTAYVTTDFNRYDENVKIVLEANKIGGYGIWYDYVLGRPVMSDAFKRKLIGEGFAPFFLGGILAEEVYSN